jgi:3-phosphoshikimate 1-carboxyvinyltransferase
LIFAALAEGESEISGLNPGADVESTAGALRDLGVKITRRGNVWHIESGGSRALHRPARPIDCGNSGTTMRLLAGVLAACPFESVLIGDESLQRRPMRRVADPLRKMGAVIEGRRLGALGGSHEEITAPLTIRGRNLRGASIETRVASAQVKSAILLAAWTAGVRAEVTEPQRSRDHTERMMRALGAKVRARGRRVLLEAGGALQSPAGAVPGDPSAAAFFAAAAAATPGSRLVLEDVLLNPTRLGFYRLLARMGARIVPRRRRTWCGEPAGDLVVHGARLRAFRIGKSAVPALVDEIPMLAILAAGACRGRSSIRGAEELRVKESDRLSALAMGLRTLGAKVEEFPDGLSIEGGKLHGGRVDAQQDHRIAMAFRIAAHFASSPVVVRGGGVMRISHPGFAREWDALLHSGRRS